MFINYGRVLFSGAVSEILKILKYPNIKIVELGFFFASLLYLLYVLETEIQFYSFSCEDITIGSTTRPVDLRLF